jgi:C-terminal processing protease CtpA/Prc
LAADAAGLLALGKVPVAKYVFQGKEEVITSREDVVTKLGTLVIRQDGLTASSSELLITLLQEAMPDSILITGDPSFGKGEFQQTDSIQDAGKISLTRGSLVTSKGNSWDKKPIQPTLKK